MRLALLVHGLPPERCTGVEVHALALARAWAERGVTVEAFTQVADPDREHLSQERVVLGERLAVTRLAVNRAAPDERGRRIVRGADEAFARFLDRERPHLVHVEHALGVGPGALHAARQRGIPVVVQAHDPLAISLDHLLLRTDGSPLPLASDGRPIADDLARNALARAALERTLAPGEHGAVVLPRDLPTALADEVYRILFFQPTGDCATELARLAGELAGETDEWRAAFDAADCFCASSEGLAAMLREGGVRVDRVVPCGIDATNLRRLRDRPPRDDGAPLRFGVLGGLRPHKGAQVALAAFERLRAADVTDVELALHGEGEAIETRTLRARAADVGATAGAAFEPTDLPRLLAELDVVLVPSIWPENAPFVIREAFAAGVPVVASRIGAMPESLSSGGGLLVEPDDAPALAEVMRELARDRDAYRALRDSIPAPLSIEAEAASWECVHQKLVAGRAEHRANPRASLPTHLTGFAARFDAWNDAPLRELVAFAIDGVEDLAQRLLPGAASSTVVAALDAADGPREALAAARREAAWSREVADERAEALDEAQRALAWREEQLRDREAELRWREARARELEDERDWRTEQLAARDATLAEAHAQRDEATTARDAERERAEGLAERVETLEREAAWLRDRTSAAEEAAGERAWLADSLRDREAHLAEAERALIDLRAALAAVEAERDWRAGTAQAAVARAEGAERTARELRDAIEARDDHLAFLRAELTAIASALDVELGEDAAWPDALAAAKRELDRRTGELQRNGEELTWRAHEMRLASEEASRGLARRIRAAALRRARGWREEDAR